MTMSFTTTGGAATAQVAVPLRGFTLPAMDLLNSRKASAVVERAGHTLRAEALSVWYGGRRAVGDVNMEIVPRAVTAIIGPSGCGKSTFLRCLNRMHEVTPGAPRVAGKVLLDGVNIYASTVDA